MRGKLLFVRTLILFCCVFVSVFSAPALFAAAPKYPQTFNLLPGEQTYFGFPLTKTGSVQAELTWQGGMALAVTLVDMDGHTKASAKPAASSARLAYEATAADVARAAIWRVTIAYPNGTPGAAASGSITIRYPEADPAQVSQLEQSLTKSRPKPTVAAPTSMPAAHKANVEKALAELKQPAQQQAQQQAQQYKAQADTQYAAAVRSALAPVSPPTLKAAAASAAKVLTSTQLAQALATRVPTLMNATPAQAAPGELVTLYGKNFTVQNGLYQAAFTVRGAYVKTESTNNPNRPVNVVEVPALVLSVPVESVSQLADGRQQFTVHAPMPPAGSTLSPYDGDVSLKTTAGFTSNPVPLRYQVSMPVPQTVTPYEVKAGAQLTLNGSKFASTDVLHVVMSNDGQDRIVPSTFISETSIQFTAPAYASRTRFGAAVYLTRVVNGTPVASKEAPFVLAGNVMDITALSVQQAPMDVPMIISGINIEGTPTVNFKLDNRLYAGTVTQVSPTAIYVVIPKMGGVVNNTPCEVSVSSGGKTLPTTLTFTYVVTYVHEVFRVCTAPFKTDVKFGEPLTDIDQSGLGATGCDSWCFYGLWCVEPGSSVNGESFIYGGHQMYQFIYFGKTGFDDYFSRSTLRNGWKLEKVVVTIDPRTHGSAGAYLFDSGIGTSTPRAQIRWWGEWAASIQYIVTLFVTGAYETSPY
jgi:hypothetical protein